MHRIILKYRLLFPGNWPMLSVISLSRIEEEDSDITTIKFYVPDNDDKNYKSALGFYLNSLAELHPEYDLDVALKEKSIQNVEWEDSYKESVKPILIDEQIGVLWDLLGFIVYTFLFWDISIVF